MKTEKQVRTWWLVAHHSDPETPIHIFDLPIDEGIKVIAHEDHLAIVAELETRIEKLRSALEQAKEAYKWGGSENADGFLTPGNGCALIDQALKDDENSDSGR